MHYDCGARLKSFQWIEQKHTKKDKKNGHEDVYYTYSLEWSEVDVDSSTFHDKASASNPTGHSQHDVYNQDGGGRIRYQDSTHLTHENPGRESLTLRQSA